MCGRYANTKGGEELGAYFTEEIRRILIGRELFAESG